MPSLYQHGEGLDCFTRDLFQLRPRLPCVPALLKLRLSLFQGCHAIRTRHRAVDGHRLEPAQTVGTAAGLIDAADIPAAAVDGVVRAVLVDRGAGAGRAELEGHSGNCLARVFEMSCATRTIFYAR